MRHLFANNDEPGRRGAEKAADAFTRQSCRVILRFPPDPAEDWNDALRALARKDST